MDDTVGGHQVGLSHRHFVDVNRVVPLEDRGGACEELLIALTTGNVVVEVKVEEMEEVVMVVVVKVVDLEVEAVMV